VRGLLHNMKRHLIFYEKRAVTEMVAYVAMVIVAFSISILIYSYLQVQAPKDRPECPEGVSLRVKDVTCTLLPNKICNGMSQGGTGKMDITLFNNGKRSISGAFIRFGLPGSKVKESINKDTPFFKPLTDTGQELLPGRTLTQSYTLALGNQVSIGEQSLEIEPVFGEPNNLALCEDSVVTRRVSCSFPKVQGGIPTEVTGTYVHTSRIDPGSIDLTIIPDANYRDSIDFLEMNLYRQDGANWVPVTGTPKKADCPETNSAYSTKFTGLSGGDQSTNFQMQYKAESFIVLYDGTKIPIKYQSTSDYLFTIFGCRGFCRGTGDGTFGVYVELVGGGSNVCVHTGVCERQADTNVYKKMQYSCQRACYTGYQGIDYGMITAWNNFYSNDENCAGSSQSVIGPYTFSC